MRYPRGVIPAGLAPDTDPGAGIPSGNPPECGQTKGPGNRAPKRNPLR